MNLGGRKRGEGLQQKGFARPRVYGCRILPAHPRPHLRMQTAGTQPEPSREWGPAAVGRALRYGAGHQTFICHAHGSQAAGNLHHKRHRSRAGPRVYLKQASAGIRRGRLSFQHPLISSSHPLIIDPASFLAGSRPVA